MTCQEIRTYVDSFIDGEFADPERVEFETHLMGCAPCRKLVQDQAGFKTSLRLLVHRPAAPLDLRRRLDTALDGADQELEHAGPAAAVGTSWLPKLGVGLRRLALPLLAVCLPLLFLIDYRGASRFANDNRDASRFANDNRDASRFANDNRLSEYGSPVMEDSIVKHQRNLPLEITGGRDVVVNWFDGKVPFAVRAPQLEPAASLRGGRLVNLGSREAAYLSYERGGHKISVFVFDPSDLRLVSPRHQLVGSHEVYLEGAHGYYVAVFRDHGLAYAITGSLDEPEMLRLISTAVGGR